MLSNKQIGVLGEQTVKKALINRGFVVLATNIRFGRAEFDLIVSKNSKLHVIEVKTRTSSSFGAPEEAVTDKKYHQFEKYYYQIAEEYGYEDVHYVIAAVQIDKNKNQCQIKFIKVS